MKHIKYQKELGSTVAFTKRMMEAKKGIVQKYRKGTTNDFYFLYLVLLKEGDRSCHGS